jgi:uncharacterized membrane protein YciS (DUF1049 family)
MFVPWLFDHGVNLQLLVSELLSTKIGALFGADVIVAAIVLIVLYLAKQLSARWKSKPLAAASGEVERTAAFCKSRPSVPAFPPKLIYRTGQ